MVQLFKLEYFVLEHLQLIWNVVNIFHVATLSDAFKIHNQRINQILIRTKLEHPAV